MLRDLGIVLTFDFIILLVMIGFLYPKGYIVYNSSKQLFWVGVGFVLYETFFVVRNAILLLLCLCSPDPNRRALIGRLGWTCVDLFLLTSFLIWASTVTFTNDVKHIKEQSTHVSQWWLFCSAAIGLGWIYILVLCCFWAILCPIVSVFTWWIMLNGRAQASQRADRWRT